MTLPAKHISISINANPADVYHFAADPRNLPKWAAGLSQSELVKSGDAWIADSPMGSVKVQFAAKNDWGVLDHDVTLPSGEVFHNPLRILKNQSGSEVVFTLFRHSEMSDTQFEDDATRVAQDLANLKKHLEKKP